MPDTTQRERPLFSSRYGIRSHLDAWGRDHFIARHTHTEEENGKWGPCELGPLRCACPGSREKERCCQRATQEDRICDERRDWCYAVDGQRVFHRFIDLYGAA